MRMSEWGRSTEDPAGSCPFCFPAHISPAQLLVSTPTFYLLAPAGQIVEGFLCIMTHTCSDEPARLRCLDDVSEDCVDELRALRSMVIQFFGDVYKEPPIFYENGRGGGHYSSLPGGTFKFHPHLCAIPARLKVHDLLQPLFPSRKVTDFPHIRAGIGRRPYLYIHTPGDAEFPDPLIYYSNRIPDGFFQDLNLKKLLAERNGLGRGWDWRAHADALEIRSAIDSFNSWYECTFCS